MTTWVAAVKNLLAYYLATQNDNYLTTEDGLLLWIVDYGWDNYQKY